MLIADAGTHLSNTKAPGAVTIALSMQSGMHTIAPLASAFAFIAACLARDFEVYQKVD